MGAGSSSKMYAIRASLSSEDLGNLIASMGPPFVNYKELIVNHEINGESLMSLIEDDEAVIAALKSIGITNMIHQKAISSRLKALDIDTFTERRNNQINDAGAEDWKGGGTNEDSYYDSKKAETDVELWTEHDEQSRVNVNGEYNTTDLNQERVEDTVVDYSGEYKAEDWAETEQEFRNSAAEGIIENVQYYLENNVNVLARDLGGNSALHFASMRGIYSLYW